MHGAFLSRWCDAARRDPPRDERSVRFCLFCLVGCCRCCCLGSRARTDTDTGAAPRACASSCACASSRRAASFCSTSASCWRMTSPLSLSFWCAARRSSESSLIAALPLWISPLASSSRACSAAHESCAPTEEEARDKTTATTFRTEEGEDKVRQKPKTTYEPFQQKKKTTSDRRAKPWRPRRGGVSRGGSHDEGGRSADDDWRTLGDQRRHHTTPTTTRLRLRRSQLARARSDHKRR